MNNEKYYKVLRNNEKTTHAVFDYTPYQNAKTDVEKTQLFKDTFSSEEERENARAILENVDKFDGEIQKAFANILAGAAKVNARETEELDRRAQDIAVFNDVKEDSDGAKKFTIVENLLDKLGAREDVVMINSASDLETLGFSPEKAQEIFSQVGKKGLYSAENDKVYMLPSHFKNGVDAFRTFAHERGHWIADKMKNTPEYRGMLSTILQLTGGEENLRSLLPTSYANDNASSLAEEYLMRVVERVAMEEVLNANQKGVWNFFKTKFKKWFGGENTFANVADKQIADIARDIYKRAVGEKPKLGNYWEAGTPENNSQKVSGMWEVVDASELITSTDNGYDDTLQPRNRNRQASTVQTSQIATYLDPARLDSDTTTDKGAPIIDARKMIISGNGRTLAIREAYGAENKERARAYREFVLRRAEELGIDVDANIKNPVLVRRVDNLGDMTLADFAARSNKSQVAAMSNAENAIADARRILDAHLLDIFFPSENGDVLAASNNDFITGFLEIIGNREEYVDKHGARKPNLAPRVKAAVLAATLNPEKRDIIEDLLDNPQGWSGLINGLLGSVANLAKLDGNVDYDLANELSEAVEIYVGLARAGETVATFNAQEDFLRPQISEEVGFLIELFEKNSRTPTGVSGVLNEYYNLVKNIDTTSQDMFGVENPPKIDQLRQAYGRYATDLTNKEIKLRDTGSDNLDNLDNDFKKQIAEVRAKYENTPMWLKAPNGQPSKLTEEQWLAVRTPNFKKWFGDWETLAIINEVRNMPALELEKPISNYSEVSEIKKLFGSFGVSINDRNKQSVIFAKGSVGKIVGHKSDVPISEVLDSFKDLFESSVLAIEEKEVLKEGHKEHTNFKGYEHYVNKFNYNGKPYYIRFTVQVENAKPQTIEKGYVPRKVHSSMITDVSIYKENPQSSTDLSTSGTMGVPIFDSKLADFLTSVNEKDVSKVIDENGEPLVVYHGTNENFAVFKKSSDGGFHFGTKEQALDRVPNGNVLEVFLNVKHIKRTRDKMDGQSKNIKIAKKEGFDGLVYGNIFEGNGEDSYVAFNSNQIKSATDNIGTYSENPDIRWREVETRSPEELDAINKQFTDLYEQYKNGKVELSSSERNEWAKNLYGERGDLIKSADYPKKIYDIDEAYKFARENFQGSRFRSKDNHCATLSRNAIDKMNSGKARGKTSNNRLHAFALANIGRVFGNSELLETEKPRNGVPEIKAYLKFYAPLYLDGQLYAVKITAKEFNGETEKGLYSIEGIDVNRESDQSGLSENVDKTNSSTAILVSDSVKSFIGKLQEVNKKIDSDAREYSKTLAYEKAVQLVAEEAKRKGYDVKVYHGTGADGFNIADATSKHEKNGEGAQAHGKGLYMAVSRDTAEGYRNSAKTKNRDVFIKGKPLTWFVDAQKLLYAICEKII